MAPKKSPLDKILEAIDKQVEERGKAVIAELKATEKIADLASQARRQGATMHELTRRVKRMDRRDRKLRPVTRQAVDAMLAVHENRRPARTTRASRRRREPEAGKLNTEALK